VTSAVALSGLVDGPFSFHGFLPRKGSKRRQALSQIERSALPVVLFESPHRIAETLVDLRETCGNTRVAAVCRELTKKFEETIVLPLGELSAPDFRENWLGEFTLVIEGNSDPTAAREGDEYDVDERARALLAQGNSVKDTAQTLSKELHRRGEKTSRRELYGRVLALGAEDDTEAGTGSLRGLVGREP
jgi:16S rRNA (cytidine1402-2'-O)-methyltransferase